MMHQLAMFNIGNWEWLVILIVGLLLFGRRLPEVGRSVGKTIVEFKKGVKGIEDEIDAESRQAQARRNELSRSEPAPSPSNSPATPALRADERSIAHGDATPYNTAAEQQKSSHT